MKVKKPRNFIGRGVDDGSLGRTPGEHPGMGYYYGRAHRNPTGTLRSDTVGYNPVSKKKINTPPRSVV